MGHHPLAWICFDDLSAITEQKVMLAALLLTNLVRLR
jgi:hypothetical protein